MPNSFIPIAYVLAFIAVVVFAQTVAGVIFTTNDRSRAVNRRLTLLQSGLTRDQVYAALVRKITTPVIDIPWLRKRYESLALFCHQAGLSMSPVRLFVISAVVTGAVWLVGLTVISATGKSFVLNSAVSLLGACILSILGVWFWVGNRRAARLRQIEEQLPLALDVVNRAIRAGHPVVSAVQLAAHEMSDPVGSEFGLIVDETTYGAEFKDALANFARRTGSSDAHFFAVCVGIQSETGGNLAEILEGLASVIRARITLSKRIKALASEGKASAYLLSALPPAMVGIMMLTSNHYYSDKFSDPIFWPTVAGVVFDYLLGWFMINRIINFKY